MSRNGLLHQSARRRPWIVYSVCIFVALLPLAMWWQRYSDVQDREDRETISVQVTSVTEQGNEDLVTALNGDEEISFSYPGNVSEGDEVEVYFSDSQWKAVEIAPLWVPIAATALLWIPVGFIFWRYPIFARKRGWSRSS